MKREEGMILTNETIHHWDSICFTSTRNELAPKGFKESKHKNYNGAVVADIPFLSKKSIDKVGSITASLVRSFRKKTAEAIQATIDQNLIMIKQAKIDHEVYSWFRFTKRKVILQHIQNLEYSNLVLKDVLTGLNQIPIK